LPSSRIEEYVDQCVEERVNKLDLNTLNNIDIPDYGEAIQKVTNKLYGELNSLRNDLNLKYFDKHTLENKFNVFNEKFQLLEQANSDLTNKLSQVKSNYDDH